MRYWPGRNEAALRQNVEQMNCAIAAAASAMKDFDRPKGTAGVQSPIFAHPQFEHLEAEGAARGHAAALRNALSKSGSFAPPEGQRASAVAKWRPKSPQSQEQAWYRLGTNLLVG